uniref:Rho family GTPase 2 n=1 Tax=Amphiprion ocellaris TaxID=80972 RepID=A0AAQ6A6L9_AMPOC
MDSLGSRCKIVVVGDAQCGKTALLHVFAKDCYPENYVPTVFENYTASFEIEKHRIELNMWDTSAQVCCTVIHTKDRLQQLQHLMCDRHQSELAVVQCSSYYDNVRPLAYPDSDAVLICFDISRPETLDSVIKKWQGETQEFCPNAKVVLVGCKLDMRTDVNTLRELSKQRLIPVTHEQGSTIARQMGAVAYVECTSKVSENSVRDVFHITTLASVRRPHPQLKRSSSRRGLKRVSQLPLPPLPGRTEQMDQAPAMRKDRAKSCVLM